MIDGVPAHCRFASPITASFSSLPHTHTSRFAMIRNVRVAARRFQSTGSFKNTYNFNTNPPPVHEYWNMRNSSVLIAFVPVYFAVAYVAKGSGEGLSGSEGIKAAADAEYVKGLDFGQAQTK